MRRAIGLALVASAAALVLWSLKPAALVRAQKAAPRIPHGQTKMPGPALTPQEAIRKMTVPEGFSVELVAGEPDIVNPVAMTFDERGRVWITESLEYPRFSAGPGRDRIKVLEDTDGDGRADKFTIFADGLNIPSGIAVGHGGVWVANAPDILFLQDTDGDGRADTRKVVVTGFGRRDTHELPNSLTWGPDGWLYGLNGVFNPSHVRQNGKDFHFTCALFRIHPKTHEFQLFAEGTSNPWGVAVDTEGSFFVSACVIDHLWHLAETGYYHRQGGPYPPFTWKLGSIVRHKHQKAAYCGITYFDSDAYPAQYRDRLYMGNIHGNCINVDVLQRAGSTYFATGAPDFLSANDPWFMPVVQKTGPDGSLYVLDWYDRYHCYQDARRDPEGIDRKHGRLYRVRYKDTPRAKPFDLAKESDDQLLARLASPNVYFRDVAQRLLTERGTPAVRDKLGRLVLDASAPRKARLHALWSLVGTGSLEPGFHARLLEHEDATFRAWGVRAAGNMGKLTPGIRSRVALLAHDPSPDVQLQVAIAAKKIEGLDPFALWMEVLSACGDDPLIPVIVWQNMHPLMEDQSGALLARMEQVDMEKTGRLPDLLPRIVERILSRKKLETESAVRLLALAVRGRAATAGAVPQCLAILAQKVQDGEIKGDQVPGLRRQLAPVLDPLLAGDRKELHLDAICLAATLGHEKAMSLAHELAASARAGEEARIKALDALIRAGDRAALEKLTPTLLDARSGSEAFRGQVLGSLGDLEEPWVGTLVLAHYPRLEPALRPRAIELLTQRLPWSRMLLEAVAAKKVSASALNVNHVRRLLASKDEAVLARVKEHWGTLREERSPEREKVVADMRDLLRREQGDPVRGMKVFQNVCAQCHKMHGQGQEVGPDITGNGRSTFDQLLSNVFDPSLVIGSSYQSVTLATSAGRVLTGLVIEDSPQRVVLKLQGGKVETVARGDVEEMTVSRVSLMPEGLEKQLKPQEIVDLFAFLVIDRHPDDPAARKIPGAP